MNCSSGGSSSSGKIFDITPAIVLDGFSCARARSLLCGGVGVTAVVIRPSFFFAAKKGWRGHSTSGIWLVCTVPGAPNLQCAPFPFISEGNVACRFCGHRQPRTPFDMPISVHSWTRFSFSGSMPNLMVPPLPPRPHHADRFKDHLDTCLAYTERESKHRVSQASYTRTCTQTDATY